MRLKSRALSLATSLALLSGAAGFGAVAIAAAPTITRTVTVTDTTATIDWTTDVPTKGNVSYGTTFPLSASTTMETSFATSHTVTLTGLSASTTYQYQIDVVDASGNTATFGPVTFTTNASSSGPGLPVISNITVDPLTSTGATISWNTDSAASTQVFYGTTSAYGSTTTLNSTLSTSHSVNLTGLQASTTYHYQVQSTNSAGTATSADRTFTTPAATSTPVVLSLDGVTSVNGLALADNTYQNGFRWVLRLTVPDSETSFALRFNDFTSTTTSTDIPVAGNLRYYSAQSSNATNQSTAITETNNDYGANLNLTGDLSTTTPGRQIEVTVELKVPTGTQAGVYSSLFGARSL